MTADAVFESQADVILGMADAIERLEKKKKILGGDGPKSIYTGMMEKLVASWEVRRKTAEQREKMLQKAATYRQAEAARADKRKRKLEKLAERGDGTGDGDGDGEAHVSLRDDTWNEKFFTETVRHFASWEDGWQAVKAAFANKRAYGNALVPIGGGVLRPGGGGGSGIRKWQDSAGYRVGLFECGRKQSKGESATRVGAELKALPNQPEFKWCDADEPAAAGGAGASGRPPVPVCISMYQFLY